MDIPVRDKETGNKESPELLKEGLGRRKSTLVSKKMAKEDAKELAQNLLNAVLEQQDVWEIRERNKGVYSVIGYGLGYSAEQIVEGEWYYYEDSKTIEPKCPAGIKLRDAITAKD